MPESPNEEMQRLRAEHLQRGIESALHDMGANDFLVTVPSNGQGLTAIYMDRIEARRAFGVEHHDDAEEYVEGRVQIVSGRSVLR